MEGDPLHSVLMLLHLHFNPLPPHGGRRYLLHMTLRHQLFQSTPSAWRETVPRSRPTQSYQHFNPLPPHGGRHTSRSHCKCSVNFNPLPPHGGRRFTNAVTASGNLFQSTPSAWRETPKYGQQNLLKSHFNPLPPHGGRRSHDVNAICIWSISIHSLRMEGDQKWQ